MHQVEPLTLDRLAQPPNLARVAERPSNLAEQRPRPPEWMEPSREKAVAQEAELSLDAGIDQGRRLVDRICPGPVVHGYKQGRLTIVIKSFSYIDTV